MTHKGGRRICLAALFWCALAAPPASAQANWPETPLIVGIGFDTCQVVLAAPDDAVRRAMVSQWALGFYSGLAMAGAEDDSPSLDGLDGGVKAFFRANVDPRRALNARIIEACARRPDDYLAQVAVDELNEILDGDVP